MLFRLAPAALPCERHTAGRHFVAAATVAFGVFTLCTGCDSRDVVERGGNESTGSIKPGPDHEPGTGEAVSHLRLIDSGLSAAERDEFFHLTMGSELFPLLWMHNLISSETERPFLERIDRFGLVPDSTNTDALPIGLTAADSVDVRGVGKMVGMNCSACHTGIVTYNGASVVIVGGSSLFDVEKFTSELFTSAADTAKDPEKLVNFVHRLWYSGGGGQSPMNNAARRILSHLQSDADARKRLAAQFQALTDHALEASPADLMQSFRRLSGPDETERRTGLLHGFESEVRHAFSAGLGELDVDLTRVSDDLRIQAMDHLSEEFFIVARLLAGRIAFAKELAELKKLDLPTTHGGPGRADDFGAGRNLLFGASLAQPMTGPCSIPPLFDVAGVQWTDWDGNTSSTMGRSMLTALAGGAAFNSKTFTSTVSAKNIARLEELATKLKPPAWPAHLFGELDADKVDAGETLFREHCAKCHRRDMVAAQDLPMSSVYPLSELKTDPNRLQNYLRPLGERNFAAALQQTSQAYLDAALRDGGISAEAAAKMTAGHPNTWRDTDGYAARRLTGIWSTAPYLHNGSVPTLAHLLTPENRPEKFATGNSGYDPENVGFVFAVSDTSPFVFDTTVSGNSNVGHTYGAQLTLTEKRDLIEFLKSL